MVRAAFVILLLFSFQFALFGQSTFEKVQALELNKSEENIIAYYSDGYKQQSEIVKDLLGNSTEYFESTFDLNETFSIAVLDSNDWKKVTQIPYGLPFVSGPPNIVCIPSSNENALARVIKEATVNYELANRYGKPVDQTINLFTSLIGFHELGHIYARGCKIDFPNKWTFEFAATYFAYLYLKENAPTTAALWIDVAKILVDEIKPKFTSLKDFEELYVRVGIANYAWYQVVFLLRAAETANRLQADFIQNIKPENSLTNGNDFSITSLEKINPGFKEWAKKYKLIN